MDFFRNSNPVPTAPASQPNSTVPATNGNPPVPAATDKSPGGNEPVADPNAAPDFSTLWEDPKDNDPKLPNFDPSSMFNLDMAKINESAKQLDFSKAVSEDQLRAIAAGGEEATKAFMMAMNSVAQQATQVSMIGAAKLVEQALGKANESFDARVDERVRQRQASESLRAKNPAFSSKEFSPLVSALEAQIRLKFPQASSTEITNMAESYVLKFAQSVTGNKDSESTDKLPETDWEKLFLS